MKTCFVALGCVLALVGLSGCPPRGETRVVMLVSGDASGASLVKMALGDKADVDVNEIADFFVTVTEISLDGQGGPVVVFSGATEINLLDLTGVSQLISDAAVAPGTYTKIRLSIENPRMYLIEEPEAEITDIQLTANGRLFVSQTFEVPAGQTSLILLDFDGLKLVEQGNGGFTLTPQLKVDLSVVDAAATATGTVVSNDADGLVLGIDIGDSEITVEYSVAVIYLATDGETPTGVPADLAVGVSVRVDGLLQADGSIEADVVAVLP